MCIILGLRLVSIERAPAQYIMHVRASHVAIDKSLAAGTTDPQTLSSSSALSQISWRGSKSLNWSIKKESRADDDLMSVKVQHPCKTFTLDPAI